MSRLSDLNEAARVTRRAVPLAAVLLSYFACWRAAPEEDTRPTSALQAEQEGQSTIWTGSFHLLWGDPAPGAPGAPRRRYQLVTERGEVVTLLVEDSVLTKLGGPRGLDGKRVTISGARDRNTGGVRVRSIRLAP
jgi:hypothetical protein